MIYGRMSTLLSSSLSPSLSRPKVIHYVDDDDDDCFGRVGRIAIPHQQASRKVISKFRLVFWLKLKSPPGGGSKVTNSSLASQIFIERRVTGKRLGVSMRTWDGEKV